MTSPGLVSVVVTVVDGGAALRRCLTALTTQENAPPMEILVPYDASVASVRACERDFPVARFLDMGTIATRHAASSGRGQHELIDRRRAAGLMSVRGDVVAVIEDRAVPRSDWAATAVRLHATLPFAVIGGAVENGYDRVLAWAVYYCDFGRYQRPFVAGSRQYVTDVNVTYKRHAVEQTRDIWANGYHEPLVHGALQHAGETLFVSPDLIVDEMRDDLRLRPLVAERLAWGRLFGALRVRDASLSRRVWLTAASPLIPVVLFARWARDRLTKGTPLHRVIGVAPVVALLLSAWVVGEAVGSATGEP